MDRISELEKVISSDYANTTGIVVLKNGEKVYESYFNGHSADDAGHVFSVTKSIISALIGIALDKGYIKSTEQKILEFFPDYILKRGEKTIQNIVLKDMLCMTAPYKYKYAPYTKYFTSEDWVKAALDLLGGKGETGKFRYTPIIGPDIFSGIIEKSTGQHVIDFANENLFSPLGIAPRHNLLFQSAEEQFEWYKKYKCEGEWVIDPQGVNTAGWGLTLTTSEMAKIGQLYLNGGAWEGKRLISSEWIDESTSPHSRWEEQNLSYGYLWWIIDENSAAAMGDGGNTIYFNKKDGIVVSASASFKPRAKDRIELIKKYIEPMLIQT